MRPTPPSTTAGALPRCGWRGSPDESPREEGLPCKLLTPQPLATVRDARDSLSARCVLPAGPRGNAAARQHSSLPGLGMAHCGRASETPGVSLLQTNNTTGIL